MTSSRDFSHPIPTWPNRPVTIDLTIAHRPQAPARPDAWLRGRMCYLPRLGAIVQPTHPIDQRWRCLIVAHRQPGHGSSTQVGGDELAAAPTTLTINDDAGFVLAWLCAACSTGAAAPPNSPPAASPRTYANPAPSPSTWTPPRYGA